MLCPGGGSRSSSAAAAAAWSEGCWAETQRRRRRRATATTTRRRRRRKSWTRSRPQHREAGTLGVEEEAAAIRSLRLGSGRRGLNPEGPCAPLAIRVPRAAEEAVAAAVRADGTRAPEEQRLRAAMTFPSSRPPRREEHKGGGAPWSPGGAQDTSDSAPSPNRNWPLRLSQSDRSLRGGAGTTACANRSASGVLGGASVEWPALRPPRGLVPISRRWRLRFHCQLEDAVSRADVLGAPREGAWRFGLLPRVDPDPRSRRRSRVPASRSDAESTTPPSARRP